jgi:beta-lactamase regulating signal transducer with metallopeptidase domain
MTMSAFLLLLVKLNLAMGAAIILVSLLRRPLRLLFGAPIAYAIWFAVPIAGVASLFPPRVEAPSPVPSVSAAVSAMGPLAHSALRVTEQLAGQSTIMPSAIAPPSLASTTAMPDIALLLFAAWALGTLFMALYLIRLQLRFSAAVRSGEAGPAVLGFLRPRIVTPDSFQEHFTPQEQVAILTHERVHLARQDARVNALTAFLRCLCWFNPFIHLGAHWLRIDQELACDATAVAGAISRRTYAKALLKSQLVVTALPLGCNWPGSQHPLIERIVLLKRNPPGTARRLAGVGLVLLAASFAGLGAWAAQPPVTTKPMAQPGMALATLSSPVAAPGQTAVVPSQPVADANPVRSSNAVATSKIVHADSTVSPVPVRVQAPSSGSIAARMESALAALPQPAPVSLALNAAGGSPKTFTTPSDAGTDAVVMANTPSGEGDPNTIVCRAPQRIAGSGQFGPEACGHNYEWQKLAMSGKDLAWDGKTLIDRPTVRNPKGEGDPDTITCRTPQFIMRGPLVEVCLPNRFWADLAKNHQIVDAYGVVVEQRRPNRDYSAPYGPAGYPYNNSNNSNNSPGYDSGNASQSSAGGGSTQTYGGYTP